MRDKNYDGTSDYLPFIVIGSCGSFGVAVDALDGLAVMGGPEWLHKLDLLTAFLLSFMFICMGAYSLRYRRTQ